LFLVEAKWQSGHFYIKAYPLQPVNLKMDSLNIYWKKNTLEESVNNIDYAQYKIPKIRNTFQDN
jgi:hypothetical protein